MEFIEFYEAWITFEHQFSKLCTFIGGFACPYPSITYVKGDFCVDKDEYKCYLMNLSVYYIMHSKQFK